MARLHTEGRFQNHLTTQMEGDYRVRFHLAAPLLSPRDPATGNLRKREYGAWILPLLRLLAGLKRFRGTPFDIFGYTEERKTERTLVVQYETLVDEVLGALDVGNHATAVELLASAGKIRGFGHVKSASIEQAKHEECELLGRFRGGGVSQCCVIV